MSTAQMSSMESSIISISKHLSEQKINGDELERIQETGKKYIQHYLNLVHDTINKTMKNIQQYKKQYEKVDDIINTIDEFLLYIADPREKNIPKIIVADDDISFSDYGCFEHDSTSPEFVHEYPDSPVHLTKHESNTLISDEDAPLFTKCQTIEEFQNQTFQMFKDTVLEKTVDECKKNTHVSLMAYKFLPQNMAFSLKVLKKYGLEPDDESTFDNFMNCKYYLMNNDVAEVYSGLDSLCLINGSAVYYPDTLAFVKLQNEFFQYGIHLYNISSFAQGKYDFIATHLDLHTNPTISKSYGIYHRMKISKEYRVSKKYCQQWEKYFTGAINVEPENYQEWNYVDDEWVSTSNQKLDISL